MRKYISCILFVVIGICSGYSQTQKAYIEAAEEALLTKNYYGALTWFSEALEFDEDDYFGQEFTINPDNLTAASFFCLRLPTRGADDAAYVNLLKVFSAEVGGPAVFVHGLQSVISKEFWNVFVRLNVHFSAELYSTICEEKRYLMKKKCLARFYCEHATEGTNKEARSKATRHSDPVIIK